MKMTDEYEFPPLVLKNPEPPKHRLPPKHTQPPPEAPAQVLPPDAPPPPGWGSADSGGCCNSGECATDNPTANPGMPQPPSVDEIRAKMMDDVVEMIKRCYDPEIPVDIWELGLVYRVDIDKQYNVTIDMTLTSPMCPVAGELPLQVQDAVKAVDMVNSCTVELVWEPPWTPEMMSEAAKFQLDMF